MVVFFFCIHSFAQTNAGDFLIPYRKGNLFGYADTSGNIKIKPQFDHVEFFARGYARFVDFQRQKVGLMNAAGKIILPANFNYITRDDDFILSIDTLNSRYGVYNKTGKNILPHLYSDINVLDNHIIATVNDEKKFTFYKAQKPEELLMTMHLAFNRTTTPGQHVLFLYSPANQTCTKLLTSDNPIHYEYDYGFDKVISFNTRKGGKILTYDPKGKLISQADPDKEEYGIGGPGEDIGIIGDIPNPIHEGWSVTSIRDKNGKFHLVRVNRMLRKRDTLSEAYDEIYGKMDGDRLYINKFYYYKDSIWLIVKRNGQKGIINGDGKIIVPLIYEDIVIEEPRIGDRKGLPVKVKKDNRWGLINTLSPNKYLLECRYTDILRISPEGGVIIMQHDTAGFAVLSGTRLISLIEPRYKSVQSTRTVGKTRLLLVSDFKGRNYYCSTKGFEFFSE